MSGVVVSIRKRLPGFVLDAGWAVDDGFTVLFGYSGAGKSLTLGALAGTMRPDEGHVRLGEQTLFDSRTGTWVPPQKRRMGYVPQNAQLFPHMTVGRNVEFALKGVGRAERAGRVDDLLARMHIAQLADRHPHQLSGGQLQRAALARALAAEPRALLLDEPFSALDLPVRVEMRELLLEVQRDLGVPVVMVTHDLYEACVLADTLVVYSGAGTVQTGCPRELIEDPATPEIRRLLHAMELPDSVFGARHARHAGGAVVPLSREENVA